MMYVLATGTSWTDNRFVKRCLYNATRSLRAGYAGLLIGCSLVAAGPLHADSLYPTRSTATDWNYRRLVVGADAQNRPYFARQDSLELTGSYPSGERMVWAEDSLPITLPTDGVAPGLKERPAAADVEEALGRASDLPVPGTSGVRIFWYEFGPDYKAKKTTPFHWHDSAEIWSIAQGEVVLILQGGAEQVLHRGDSVVVTGVDHRWENRSGKSCIASVVALAAVRKGTKPPAGDDLTKEMTTPYDKSNLVFKKH